MNGLFKKRAFKKTQAALLPPVFDAMGFNQRGSSALLW
jgi:hypothetical protein